MNYDAFKPEDFIMDEHFQRWVWMEDEDAAWFWEDWLERHPGKRETLEQARRLLLAMQFEKAEPTAAQVKAVWQRIQSAKSDRRRRFLLSPRFYRTTAAIGLLMVAALVVSWFLSRPQWEVLSTTYGQQLRITLPDSTLVQLNANSELRYAKDLADRRRREVWLKGEAFFTVTRMPQPQPFIVHTAQLEVEVLGTRFNVNSREEAIWVVLTEGKVKLNLKDRAAPEIVMQPGEMIAFTKGMAAPRRQIVKTEVYTAWTNNELIFDDWTLAEIAEVLENNFGYRIRFATDSLAQKHFTLKIPAQEVELIFPAVAKSLNLNVVRQGEKEIFLTE